MSTYFWNIISASKEEWQCKCRWFRRVAKTCNLHNYSTFKPVCVCRPVHVYFHLSSWKQHKLKNRTDTGCHKCFRDWRDIPPPLSQGDSCVIPGTSRLQPSFQYRFPKRFVGIHWMNSNRIKNRNSSRDRVISIDSSWNAYKYLDYQPLTVLQVFKPYCKC